MLRQGHEIILIIRSYIIQIMIVGKENILRKLKFGIMKCQSTTKDKLKMTSVDHVPQAHFEF